MTRALLAGANLTGANLTGADLAEAIFIEEVDMRKALYDDNTCWPDGFDPVKAGAIYASEAAKEVV